MNSAPTVLFLYYLLTTVVTKYTQSFLFYVRGKRKQVNHRLLNRMSLVLTYL